MLMPGLTLNMKLNVQTASLLRISKHLHQFLAHVACIFCESNAGDGLTLVRQSNSLACERSTMVFTPVCGSTLALALSQLCRDEQCPHPVHQKLVAN